MLRLVAALAASLATALADALLSLRPERKASPSRPMVQPNPLISAMHSPSVGRVASRLSAPIR